MSKLDYLGKRLLKSVFIIVALVVLNFFLIRLAPGDPASVIAGQAGIGDPEFVQQLRERFRLDEPLHEQLYVYLAGVAQLDFGYSYTFRVPVWDLIVDRLPATLLLTGTAFAISLLVGILLGTIAAAHIGRWPDTLVSGAALIMYATPLFWLGLMSILVFSVYLNLLPPFGMSTVGAGYTGWRHAIDVAHHLVLPALTLSTFMMAIYMRLTRSSILEIGDLDFVKTARAKGLGQRQIMLMHILRNAILPVVTFAGMQAGQLIGGAVITETVFAWPGLGRLTYDALLQRDYNLLLAILFMSSVMVVLFNLITDLIYTVVDPRIELS